MASKGPEPSKQRAQAAAAPPAGGGKGGAKQATAKPEPQPVPSISQQAYDPVIRSDTPFPFPDLYFHVFDSEVDEPDAKIRRDVGRLYERWQEQYGRRWPENGMNTDDLVWLAEEAYKPIVVPDERGAKPVQPPSLGAARAQLQPIEEERYPGEFLEEPVDDAPAEGQGGKGKRGGGKKAQAAGGAQARQRTPSNYEATLAGGNWVTDEFESADYEAGNLETLWGMHLWDYESKPLMMPGRPVDEAQGEESEDWDDFYGSYRPRFIDTDDAREAVWATDEFESDEDATESEWEPEYVGAGLGLEVEDPFNPQYSLRHSNHPLAPFPGEPLKWSSFVYDDGTTYEGLSRDAVPHGMGVMIFGNGTGAGFHFRDVRRGDKYEGEFQVGYAHGLGQLTSENRGEVYIGEFFAGQRHGCGIRINMQPYYYLLERGEDPVAAYQKTHERIMRNIEFRTWYRNKALGSDHEDEVVLHAVRDDLDDPAAVVLRNSLHEAKLREWATMDAGDKALRKAVEIIEGVEFDRMRRRGGQPTRSQFQVGEDGRLHEVLDTEGNDTDFDSVELMVGIDDDGGPGLGWIEDTEPSELYPYDMKLRESVMADVAEDKLEESEDKEAVLGEDLVNPFTGLTLRDYLDGREGLYKDLLRRTGVLDKLLRRAMPPPAGKERRRLAAVADGEESSYVEDAQGLDALFQKQLDALMSRSEQSRAAEVLGRTRAGWSNSSLVGGGPRAQNPFSEDTDTRFETESDQMELCELAEILGTVDEAKEIVTKARMWRWKPDGEVTYRFAQDAQGVPLPLMQDPLHYPHGTKFMAPGPLGQCHPVPTDHAIRDEMRKAAKNYAHIYSLYNFDFDPEPGSVQWKIDQRIKRAGELQMQMLGRMAEAAEAELQAEVAASTSAPPSGPRATGMETKKKSKKSAKGGGAGGAGPAGPSRPQPQAELAALPEEEEVAGPGGVWGTGTSDPFASVSLGMGQASRVLMVALTRAARHAQARRPRVLRPSQLRRQPAAAVAQAEAAGPRRQVVAASVFSLAGLERAPQMLGQQQP